MPRRKGARTPKPGTFGKGALNPKFKHGLYAGANGGTEWIAKRDFLYKLSRSALLEDEDQSSDEDEDGVDDDDDDDDENDSSRSFDSEKKAAVRSQQPTIFEPERKRRKSSVGRSMTGRSTPAAGPPAEELVNSVNALAPVDFAQRFLDPRQLSLRARMQDQETCFEITFCPVATLEDAELEACFGLIEETSAADYVVSKHGWHPADKKEEMRDSRMQYLLVHLTPGESDDALSNGNVFQGFLSFLVDTELDPNANNAKIAIIYIYELHLKLAVRGCGLGRHLMVIVEDLGRKIGIDKTMLTVFSCNTKADAFYRRLGYNEDPISPYGKKLRNGTEQKPNYYILSKEVGQPQR